MVVVTFTGVPGGEKFTGEQLSVEIRRDVNRIPEAVISILDGSVAKRKFDVSNLPFFEPGKRVSISAREGEQTDAPLFEGLVVRHSVEARPGSSALKIELKDPAYKLTRQRNSVVHRKQTDGDAVRKVISDAGLGVGELATTSAKHEELIQYQATDWDFLVERAEASGLVVDVHRGKVSMRSVVPSGGPKATYEYGGSTDLELELELDAGDQWAAVSSQAWDVQKLALSSPAKASPPSVKVGNLDIAEVAKTLGGEACALIHPAIVTPGELSAWAGGRLARTRQALLRGRLTIPGAPGANLLDLIKIAGVSDRFNGTGLVGGITHRIDQGGWKTELRLGLPADLFARQPDVNELLAGGLLPAVQGLHVGVVGDFEADPLGEHRIKVKLSVLDAKQGAVWARVARPDAGAKRGQVFWPEPGDEVVVGFIHGDPRQAIVLGALHGSKNPPPDAAGPPSKENEHRAIVSKGGVVIAIDDKKKGVLIKTPGKNQIVIDDDAKAITIADQHGNKITMDAKGITLASAADFKIDAPKGKVVISGTAVDVQ